jgi:hypothetical protein
MMMLLLLMLLLILLWWWGGCRGRRGGHDAGRGSKGLGRPVTADEGFLDVIVVSSGVLRCHLIFLLLVGLDKVLGKLGGRELLQRLAPRIVNVHHRGRCS